MHDWIVAGTAFLASSVEAVEAMTIVMAVGFTYSWRSALAGSAWAFAALLLIVAVTGPALVRFVPLSVIRLVIGAFLLSFGLSWLRKAVLRFSGRKALHDERAIFEKQTGLLAAQTAAHSAQSERIAFATAFNAVLLEGLEVAVIVVTFTATYGMRGLLLSGAGALAAFVVVCIAGIILREPCSRVPENTMKFVVGIMLASFGILWTGEGAGIAWPHGDVFFLCIAGALLLLSAGAVRIARVGA